MFVSISNVPKKIWTAIRRLTGNPNSSIPSTINLDNVEYTDSSLAAKFNDHFLQTGVTNTIPTYTSTKDLNGYVSLDSTNSMFLSPCSEVEIFNLIRSLKRDSAPGYDEIKAEPIIRVADILCAPLCHICNNALVTGICPASIKIARVVVLHKGGSLNDLNNYRPISVLPVFSKVLELILKIRITKFRIKSRPLSNSSVVFARISQQKRHYSTLKK